MRLFVAIIFKVVAGENQIVRGNLGWTGEREFIRDFEYQLAVEVEC